MEERGQGKYIKQRAQYTSMYNVIPFHSVFVFFLPPRYTPFDVFS